MHNICVARESLLTSKPTLKALLILTVTSLSFIGTCIKKATLLLLETSSVSALQRKGAGSGAAWGCHGAFRPKEKSS